MAVIREDVPAWESASVAGRGELPSVLAQRAEPIISAMASPASAVLMIGEAGSGKAYIAELVANALHAEGDVHVFTLPHGAGSGSTPESVFGQNFPAAFADDDSSETSVPFRASQIADRLLEAMAAEAQGSEPLLVLPGIDGYDTLSAAVLEQIVRRRGVRVLATAHRLVGGANLMNRDPRVRRITIAPMDPQEADAFLSHLVGVAHIAPETLSRWHAATGGNSYALTMMLLAAERRGVLRRRRGLAWVPPGMDEVPEEFGTYIDNTCSEAELATLEMIALAEPMTEPQLLRLLDPVATSTLLERNLIASRRHQSGQTALSITRPVLGAAIKNRMSPLRRIELAGACFEALSEGADPSGFSSTPQHMVGRVIFGLESGRPVPHEWLVRALGTLSLGGDPHLVLRVSLALAQGEVTEDAAAAALRATTFATLLGDTAALELAHRVIQDLLEDEAAIDRLPNALGTRLNLTLVERRFQLGASLAELIEHLDRVESALDPDDAVSLEACRSTRFKIIVENGDLADAYAARVDEEISEDITIEWVRAPARSGTSLLLQQQGHLEEAIQVAERARALSLIGKRPLTDTLELQSFCWFLGYWATGSTESAERVLEEIEAHANSSLRIGVHQSGLVEIGWAMIALQEARWRDAADLVELLVERFDTSDPYGMAPLLNAVHALALAALGEQEEAVHALRRARVERRGFSQMVAGFRRRLVVQARQWLRIGDPGVEAMALASWARKQGLGLVELEALHIASVESKPLAVRARVRARELAAEVDPLIGDVILAHIEKIADGVSASDVSEPEVRLLADLGLWPSLPTASGLSAREREVALFASLGYSSKFIAERLYLSARTVETHLAHVYTKLGIADREELRRWFSVDRAVAERGSVA